jgi:phosphopantetheinyl transferase
MSEQTNGTEIFHPPKSIGERIWFWRVAIGKATGKALAAGLNSMITTLNGVQWTTFTDSQKFVAFATMTIAMWQVMDAFLNTTMKELSESDKTQIAKETTT